MTKKMNWPLMVIMILLCAIFQIDTHAQNKKQLKEEDYSLWKSSPKIMDAETSEDGNWYAYQTGNDSVVTICINKLNSRLAYRFIAKSNSNVDRSFSFEEKSNFSQDSKHYAFVSNDTLHLIELNSGKILTFNGLKNFRFVGEGKYLFAESDISNDKKLWLRDLKNQKITIIDHVEQFAIDPIGKNIAVIVAKSNIREVKAILMTPGFPILLIASSTENTFSKLTWNKTGTVLAFYETKGISNNDSINAIHTYTHFGDKQVVTSLTAINKDLPKAYMLANDRLYVSSDGKKLFFYLKKMETIKPKTHLSKKSGVEVWLPTDPILSLNARIRKDDKQLWYQLNLDDKKLMAVTDTVYTQATLIGDGKNALIYHRNGYLPRYKYVNSFMDVFIKDLTTGASKLFLEKVWDGYDQISISPEGKFIAYYKSKNWWVYDIYQGKHICLTENAKMTIENSDLTKPGIIPPYGSPGWLNNDLLIYDKNDIWLFSADGKRKLKITNGFETNQTFRISNPTNARETNVGPGPSWFLPHLYDGNDGVLIKAVNNKNLDNGLFVWTYNSGLVELIRKPMEFSYFGKVRHKKAFLYSESAFDVSPRLILFNPSGTKELVYETNPQQREFAWGKSELVYFNTSDGKQLKGALFYPSNYVKGNRYPMIVAIYEDKSDHLHKYQMPSLSQADALDVINVTNYTSEGYAVFLPDITYELNDPGISATRCVMAGVEKVIEMGVADRKNIGLIGHSFGGYETAFIATQTDLFKTAIASAGITDISAWSLLISFVGVNFTRVESDQMRMTGTFMGTDYLRNSPMHYVHQMKTPILLWSGDKDTNVEVSQTKSFHNALWRLGKQSTMVIYNGEGHVLLNPDNQLDVTRRIKNWFDHYLKGEKPADWMIKGSEIRK